ncbi:hypothetical protein KE423_003911 [Salmonella enterica]|nr:hypothetical protein [Salmonella enterica]
MHCVATAERRAAAVLAAYLAGDGHPRKCWRRGGYCFVFNIGLRHRLICIDTERAKDASAWKLLSHQSYDEYRTRKH